MIIEFHDDALGDPRGTLGMRVGRQGTIELAYQAEEYVRDYFRSYPVIRRAYALDNDYSYVYAVWKRDLDGNTCYVAKSPEFNGEWDLPYVFPEATNMVVALLGAGVKPLDVEQWALGEIRGTIACAVLLDPEGLVAAWEKGPDNPILVAKSPRFHSSHLPALGMNSNN